MVSPRELSSQLIPPPEPPPSSRREIFLIDEFLDSLEPTIAPYMRRVREPHYFYQLELYPSNVAQRLVGFFQDVHGRKSPVAKHDAILSDLDKARRSPLQRVKQKHLVSALSSYLESHYPKPFPLAKQPPQVEVISQIWRETGFYGAREVLGVELMPGNHSSLNSFLGSSRERKNLRYALHLGYLRVPPSELNSLPRIVEMIVRLLPVLDELPAVATTLSRAAQATHPYRRSLAARQARRKLAASQVDLGLTDEYPASLLQAITSPPAYTEDHLQSALKHLVTMYEIGQLKSE